MMDSIQKVRTALSVGGISKQALADEARCHRNTLAGVEDDGWNPTVKTLTALTDAVDRIKERRA